MAQPRQDEGQDALEGGGESLLAGSPLSATGLGLAPEPEAPAGRRRGATWMVSFTDLVALLLTFFVMVFAMRDVEENTWQTITNSFVTALDQIDQNEMASPTFEIDALRIDSTLGKDLDYLRAVIESLLRNGMAPAFSTVEIQTTGVAIRAPRAAIMAPDGLSLSEAGRAYAFELAGVVGNLANAVEIVVDVPAEAGGEVATEDWADALLVGGLLSRELADSGYAAPLDVRARWRPERVAAGEPPFVDVLISPKARDAR